MELGTRQYLEVKTDEDLERDLRFFLRRGMLVDGTIRMTEPRSSRLTVDFTNVLTVMDAFTRASTLLSMVQGEACRLKFGLRWSDERIGAALGCAPRTARHHIETGLDLVVARMREIVTAE